MLDENTSASPWMVASAFRHFRMLVVCMAQGRLLDATDSAGSTVRFMMLGGLAVETKKTAKAAFNLRGCFKTTILRTVDVLFYPGDDPARRVRGNANGLAPAHSQASGFRYGLCEILGIDICA
jgi:hypothetical protein